MVVVVVVVAVVVMVVVRRVPCFVGHKMDIKVIVSEAIKYVNSCEVVRESGTTGHRL